MTRPTRNACQNRSARHASLQTQPRLGARRITRASLIPSSLHRHCHRKSFEVIRPLLLGLLIGSVSLPCSSLPQEITFEGRTIGTVESIQFENVENRSLIYLTARFVSLSSVLDAHLAQKGNLLGSRCSQRLYWAGGTSVRAAESALYLTSRIRYEQWICTSLFKTRLLRDTKTLDWKISVGPGPIDDLRIITQIENLRNFPNDLETSLRRPLETSFNLPDDCGSCTCSKVARIFETKLDELQFRTDNSDVVLTATLTAKGDTANAQECVSS